MSHTLRLDEETEQLLRCPICYPMLLMEPTRLTCVNPAREAAYPIVNGVPINEVKSYVSFDLYHGETPISRGQCQATNRTAWRRLRLLFHGPQERRHAPRSGNPRSVPGCDVTTAIPSNRGNWTRSDLLRR